MIKPLKKIEEWNKKARSKVVSITKKLNPEDEHPPLTPAHKVVNQLSDMLNQWVYEETLKVLKDQKICAIVGGDHSVPFGAFQAVAEKEKNFGILHFDAHFDLRNAYQGFQHSHASIMYNVLENIPEVKKLIQIGIRDFSLEEYDYQKTQKGRAIVYFDSVLQEKKMEGIPYLKTAKDIIKDLPDRFWVSFDIDGLDPQFCPNTGTPVPGGLHYYEALAIIQQAVLAGKTMIGFDLVEVAPPRDPKNLSEWDANVGMRLLYQLSAWCLKSHNRL